MTAAALLALFVGQPLHGPAAAAPFGAATASFASDPGVATPGGHHTHLCPLCRVANQVRFAIETTPHAALAALAFPLALLPRAPDGSAREIALCASSPRAPPHLLLQLV